MLADRLHAAWTHHNSACEVLCFYRPTGMRHKAKTGIYLIADDSRHETPEIHRWAENNVELVFTPIYACSWTLIERHF